MFTPEKTQDVELGLKYRGEIDGTVVRLNVAAYKQWVDDIQRVLYISLPSGLTALTTGVPGGATVTGLELDFSIRPSKWIEVGGSYAHTKGKYGDPNTLTVFGTLFTFDTFADIAENAGSVYAKVNLPVPDSYGAAYLRADLYAQDGQYISNTGRSSSPNTRLPGYHLLNLQAGVDDIAGTPLSVRFFMRNATNEEYYVGGISNSSLLGFNLVVPGEPRFYGVELSYSF
jgi:iron complex outermembrane receptor protein